jgi:hypothetical protein
MRGGYRIRGDPRFLKLVRRVQSLLEAAPANFKPQAFSNIINGLANIGHHPGEALLSGITGECLRGRFRDFTPQGLGTIINGFAKLGQHPGNAFLECFTEKCRERDFENFEPQNFANIINGLAKFEPSAGEAFLDAFTEKCLGGDLKGFSSQGLANILNGLASFRHHPGREILAKVDEELLRREFAGFNPQELANTISAMVALSYRPSDKCLLSFLKACRVRTGTSLQPGGKRSDEFILRDISSLLLSLSALEALDRPDSDELFGALVPFTEVLLIKAGKEDEEAADFVRDVKCALLGHERSSPGLQVLCGAVKRAWRGPEVPPPTMEAKPSRLQQHVTRAFKGMGLEVHEEVWVWGGLVSVDAVLGGERGVAVEVDGPSHFFTNRPNEPTGNTEVKRRRLRGMVERGELKGFICVEYQEWNKAETDEDKAALLRRLLREAGLEP